LLKAQGKQKEALLSEADVVFYGGSTACGKSSLLLLEAEKYLNFNNTSSVLFRKTRESLSSLGGLWEGVQRNFDMSEVTSNFQRLSYSKYNSSLQLRHIDNLQKLFDDYQGCSYDLIGFDEIQQFREDELLYLLSRSKSDIKNKIVCTVTPPKAGEAKTWVSDWVKPFLDAEGYPTKKCGELIYFSFKDDELVTADTKEEFFMKYPELCTFVDETTNIVHEFKPRTMTYIDATIMDNPKLLASNPSYLSLLKSLRQEDREVLLDGKWNI
jgi:hypothetical protein